MARPTPIGTPVTAGGTNISQQDVTFTPPVGCTAILLEFGGFQNATLSLTSVQGDPTGTPYNINDLTQSVFRANQQYAGLYGIFDSNANWPGTGSSVTVRVTLSGTAASLRVTAHFLQGTPSSGQVNSSTNSSSSSGSVSLSLSTSSSNAIDVGVCATYSADVNGGSDDTQISYFDGDTGDASVYVWTEDGVDSSNTVEPGSATVAWAGCAASIEGTAGSDTDVSASVDALTLTEYAASIGVDVSVAAAVANLTLTAFAASLASDTNIDASTDSLSLTENAADIAYDVGITSSVVDLTLTEYQASITSDTNVSAATDSLTLTENAASISFDVNVSAGLDQLTVTTYSVGLGQDIDVSASTDALTLTEFASSIAYDVNVTTSVDGLSLTEYQASIANDVSVSAGVDSLTLTEYQSSVDLDPDINVQAETGSLALTEYQASVDGARKSTGGRSSPRKKAKRRYVVEVDGEFIQVASPQEAQYVLEQVRELAKKSAERDVTTEVVPKPPRVSIKTSSGKQTTSKAIQAEVKKTQKAINREYVRAAKAIAQQKEISDLLIKKFEREEEEELIALLL